MGLLHQQLQADVNDGSWDMQQQPRLNFGQSRRSSPALGDLTGKWKCENGVMAHQMQLLA